MIRALIRTYVDAFSGLPRNVWLLSLALLINRAGAMVLAFLALYLQTTFGLTPIEAGLLLSCYGAGATVGAYLGGWLTDKLGACKTQMLSLTSTGLAFLCVPLLTSPTMLAVGLFVLAVLNDAFRPAAMAAAAELTPPDRLPRAFALLRLALNAGLAVGPAVGGLLAKHDYTLLFVCDAITCWAAAAFLFFFVPAPARPDPGTPDEGDTGDAAPKPASSPLRDGPFLSLMAVTFVGALVFFQMTSGLPLYFRNDCGLDEFTIGLLFAWNAVLIVLVEMVLTRWAETKDRMMITAAGWLLVCVGFGMMPLAGGIAYLALTITVWTVGEMLALPMITAIVAERANPTNRGRYMGIYTLSFALAFIVSPSAGLYVYDQAGAAALWLAIGALGPVLFFATSGLRRAFRAGEAPDPVL